MLTCSQYPALFAVIGIAYGGSGSGDSASSFALPDLRGRVPVGAGKGPGLSTYGPGAECGVETVPLTPWQLPQHSHRLFAASASADQRSPEAASFAATASDVRIYPDSAKPTIAPREFSPQAIDSATGWAEPHENMMPTATISYIIALEGVPPPAA
jgi:microcystin-dependent protein